MPIAANPFEMITVFGSYAGYRRATQILWAPTSDDHDVLRARAPAAGRAIAFCGRIGQPASAERVQLREQLVAQVRVDEGLARLVPLRGVSGRRSCGSTASSSRRSDPSMSPMSSTCGRYAASTSAGCVSMWMIGLRPSGFQRAGAYSTGS